MRQLLGEHTPGPWERAYVGFDGVELESKDEFLRFCAECWDKTEASGERQKHLHCTYGTDDKGEEVVVAIVGNGPKSEANAHLIAAAPDLLEACKGILRSVNCAWEHSIAKSCKVALVAIAKAEEAP